MPEYSTKKEAHAAGVTEGIRQATEAHRIGTDIMDPIRLVRAVATLLGERGITGRFSAGDLMEGSPTPNEFAVFLASRYNGTDPR